MLQEADQIKNTVALILWHIQCLHLMYSEVAWVLISLGTLVQSQIILNPDYLPDYLSISFNYGKSEAINLMQNADLTEKSRTLENIKIYYHI